jgi:hypothetical protein
VDEKIIQAYREAAPYISNIKWMKAVIDEAEKETGTISQFKEKMRQLQEEEADPTKRNDLKIYLMYLEKTF